MSLCVLVLVILASSPCILPVASRDDGSSLRSVRGKLQRSRHTFVRRSSIEVDDPARNGRDYWEQLVGTPSRLARDTKKEGVLPTTKYSMEAFDVTPFQAWLRHNSLLLPLTSSAPTSSAGPAQVPPPPLSFVCGVWINPTYKFIFIRNRKTASSTFITAVKKFMLANNLCNTTRDINAPHPNTCVMRMEPEVLARSGHDVEAMWRDYLVITSTRNPWARAASGYQFTYEKWNVREGGCVQPTFPQFCKDPFVMGKISNLFNCVAGHRDGVGQRHEGHWNFDFCHVEPAAPCMVDAAGKLVVDYVIRYEKLAEDMQGAADLINARRPVGLPAIVIPQTVAWRNKGQDAKAYYINSTDAAAFVYADKFRTCGAECVDALSEFYATDLELFGWDRPGQPSA